jgi:hypothetical protein
MQQRFQHFYIQRAEKSRWEIATLSGRMTGRLS